MPDITALVQNSAHHAWLYLPLAVLLGSLHALEPGHAKSVMAAFIVAVRGTAAQAVLLGLSAAVGHTIVVWGLALIGLWLGDKLILDKAEPWLILASGLIIVVMAARLFWMARREADHHAHDGHQHDHDHDHEHHEHGHHDHDHGHHADPEEIRQRYGGRRVSNGEIAWFGFTGGLLPCPSALAVLLVCLQLKAVTLGVVMVGAFSVGLAITLVAVGLAAAWGARKAAASLPGFDAFAAKVPYVSAGIVLLLGLVMTVKGLAETGIV